MSARKFVVMVAVLVASAVLVMAQGQTPVVKHGGKYPALHITSVVRGEADLPAHGTKDMPVWGPLFLRLSQGHEAEVQQRVANLNQYIESLQAK